MNRRGFLTGILAALVAPQILAPVLQDRQRWRVSRRKGLYIAEFRYACFPPSGEIKEVIFLKRDDFELPEPMGFSQVQYKVNPDGTITFGSMVEHPLLTKELAGKWSWKEG